VIGDILTVMWKDWRELVFHRASLRGTLASAAVVIILLGLVFPLRIGGAWLGSPMYLVYWGWVPSMLVSTLIADSFAGERERHTLETLLASRLGDGAILLGKIGASVVYGCAITFALLGAGLVTVNVAHWAGQPAGYTPFVTAAAVSITLLLSVATAAVGALASLHAATVRQAQQTLNVVLMTAGLLPFLLIDLLPSEMRAPLVDWAARVDPALWLIGGSLLMAGVDVTLLRLVSRRFQRGKLLVD